MSSNAAKAEKLVRRAHDRLCAGLDVFARTGNREAVPTVEQLVAFKQDLANALCYLERVEARRPWDEVSAQSVARHRGRVTDHCRSRADGGGAFRLSCRALGKRLGISSTEAWMTIAALVKHGVLEMTEPARGSAGACYRMAMVTA